MYFKKSDDFYALWLIIHDFQKVEQCSTFLLIICEFLSKCNRGGVFNQSEIRNKDAANF